LAGTKTEKVTLLKQLKTKNASLSCFMWWKLKSLMPLGTV